MNLEAKIPVELVGGPFCGVTTSVEPREGGKPVYLFHLGGVVWSYEWANRSHVRTGRWILTAMMAVGTLGKGGGA